MTPELAVRNLIEEMVAAWNDGQWDRFSEVFANDGIYVTSAGVRLSGRQHIATYLSSLAAGKPPDKIVLNVDSLQLVAPLIALVLCSLAAADHPESTRRRNIRPSGGGDNNGHARRSRPIPTARIAQYALSGVIALAVTPGLNLTVNRTPPARSSNLSNISSARRLPSTLGVISPRTSF